MSDPSDLARLATGIPVAILVPLCLPRLSGSIVLAPLLAATLGAIVAAPLFPDAAAWAVLVAIPATALAVTKWRPASARVSANTPTLRNRLMVVLPTLLVTAGCLALFDPDGAWHAVRAVVNSNAVIVASGGALAAIFVGGPLVAWVLSPFSAALDGDSSVEGPNSLRQAGTLIGWFERALFFAFIVGGQPQAAAVALAAKSFARFPSLSKHEEGFAEYFLIGTLASLAIALAAAVAVRAALGLSAF